MPMPDLDMLGLKAYSFKEGVHSELKAFERLDYCSHIQQMTLIFFTNGYTFSDSVYVYKREMSSEIFAVRLRPHCVNSACD